MITIRFEPDGRKVRTKPGLSILEIAKKAGIQIISECNGDGTC